MSYGQRIKSKRQEMDISQAKLADLCGWKEGRARLANYENEKREPGIDDVRKLADVLGVDPGWLLFGIGSAQSPCAPQLPYYLQDPPLDIINNERLPTQVLPILKLDQIEQWLAGTLRIVPPQITFLIPSRKLSEKLFLIQMNDDAMVSLQQITEIYCDGELALVDPHMLPQKGDTVITNVNGHIKVRQLSTDGTEIILKPLNPQYSQIKATPDVTILGVIVMTYKNRLAERKDHLQILTIPPKDADATHSNNEDTNNSYRESQENQNLLSVSSE